MSLGRLDPAANIPPPNSAALALRAALMPGTTTSSPSISRLVCLRMKEGFTPSSLIWTVLAAECQRSQCSLESTTTLPDSSEYPSCPRHTPAANNVNTEQTRAVLIELRENAADLMASPD
jgi:hypothetical protein